MGSFIRVLSLVLCVLSIENLWGSLVWGPDWRIEQKLRDETAIIVRSMSAEDLEDVWRAFLETFQKQYEGLTLEQLGKVDEYGNPLFSSVSEWLDVVVQDAKSDALKGLNDPTQRHIVAEIDGAIIGYASVKIQCPVIAYFSQGFVIENFQRHGAERLFMGTIVQSILPHEVQVLTVLTRVLNAKAIAAHQKAGFVTLPSASEEDVGYKYMKLMGYPPGHYVAMAQKRDPGSDIDCTKALYQWISEQCV